LPAFTALSGAELAIIVAYLAATLGLGLWYARSRGGETDAADYFLAGRSLPWYLIGLSLYASNMSGASFVGLMGASYAHGLVVFHYEWTAVLVLVVLAVFILPVFLRNRLFTVTEYLERRYDRRTRWAYSAFTLLTLLLIDTAGALYAGAVVMLTAFPGIDLWQASLLLSLLAGIYTISGGLRAVVFTDALQAVVMVLGAAVLAIYGLHAVGGWDGLMAGLDATPTTLIRPVDDEFLPWPGVFGVLILGFYYWAFNQYFVQRALAARSLSEGRKGALFGGLLKLPNLFLMIVPGMIAAVLYPAIASPDAVFPTLVFELLPFGLRGVVLAAMLAAIMSSLDSALNAASSLVTLDFAKPIWPRIGERALIRIGRITTALIMLAAGLYAPLIATFGSLFTYFQSTLAYLVPPIVAVYLAGLFIPRLPRNSAFWALVIVIPLAAIAFLIKEVTGGWALMGLPDLHFTYMAIVIGLLTLVIMVIVGRLEAPDAAVDLDTTFRASDIAPQIGRLRSSMLTDYRVQSVLLLALTALMLVALA